MLKIQRLLKTHDSQGSTKLTAHIDCKVQVLPERLCWISTELGERAKVEPDTPRLNLNRPLEIEILGVCMTTSSASLSSSVKGEMLLPI